MIPSVENNLNASSASQQDVKKGSIELNCVHKHVKMTPHKSAGEARQDSIWASSCQQKDRACRRCRSAWDVATPLLPLLSDSSQDDLKAWLPMANSTLKKTCVLPGDLTVTMSMLYSQDLAPLFAWIFATASAHTGKTKGKLLGKSRHPLQQGTVAH